MRVDGPSESLDKEASGAPVVRDIVELAKLARALLPGVPLSRVEQEFAEWLVPELTATVDARARLRRWAKLGTPGMDTMEGIGDSSILWVAQNILRWLPPPVSWYVCQHCLLVAVGRDTRAWCGKASTVTGARIIAFSKATSVEIVLHEFAHAFLHGQDETPATHLNFSKREDIRAAPEAFVAEFSSGDDELVELLAAHRRRQAEREAKEEREARALAAAWLRYRDRGDPR